MIPTEQKKLYDPYYSYITGLSQAHEDVIDRLVQRFPRATEPLLNLSMLAFQRMNHELLRLRMPQEQWLAMSKTREQAEQQRLDQLLTQIAILDTDLPMTVVDALRAEFDTVARLIATVVDIGLAVRSS